MADTVTEAELTELAKQGDATDAMTSACTDYACECHFKLPRLIAALREARERGLALLEEWRANQIELENRSHPSEVSRMIVTPEYNRRKAEWEGRR